jgi:hypothetical protein
MDTGYLGDIMTQPFLTMRVQSTTHSQAAVFQEIDGVLVQIGEDFGTIEKSVTINYATLGYNRVVNWFGNLYAVVTDGIWKWDTTTNGPWTKIHTFLTAVGGDGDILGLIPCEDSGEPILVTAYPTTNTNAVYVHMDKDEVVTETSPIAHVTNIFTTSPCWMTPIYHRGKILWTAHTAATTARPYIHSYDIANNSVTWFFHNAYFAKSQLCVHNNKVYMVGVGVLRTTLDLYEIGAAAAELIATIKSPSNYYNDKTPYNGFALASIDGRLVAIGQSADSTGNGLQSQSFDAYSILLDNNGVFVSSTDISSSIDPGIPIVSNSFWLYNFRADTISTPGVTIYDVEHCLNTTEVTATSNYRWNGSGNLMTDLGPGKNAWQHSRTYISEGGSGGRVWHGSGTLQVSPPTMAVNGPNVDIDFVVYGDNIADTVLGVLFDKEGEACETKGNIVQTSVGSLENGFASGIMATPSGTPVSVKWSAASDGIVSGDVPKVAGRIFLP